MGLLVIIKRGSTKLSENIKLIKIEEKCPVCGTLHQLEVPFLTEWETGSIRCFCSFLIEFNIKDVMKN